jgi:hypothetical protein
MLIKKAPNSAMADIINKMAIGNKAIPKLIPV